MDNIYQFDREYMIKAIWYIQSLLNKPNISNKVKRELRSNLNTLKNLYERNYEFYNDIHFKVPSDLEKLKRISLNKMRIVYKTLGDNLINWLLKLVEEGVFDIEDKYTKQKTNLKLKKRMKIELILFVIGFFVVSIKLAYIQFVKGKEYSAAAMEQLNASRTINANRGIIYDTNR